MTINKFHNIKVSTPYNGRTDMWSVETYGCAPTEPWYEADLSTWRVYFPFLCSPTLEALPQFRKLKTFTDGPYHWSDKVWFVHRRVYWVWALLKVLL